MPYILPPVPYDQPQTSYEWIDWYTKLINQINAGTAHNVLNSIQGGTANQYYHLTQTQHTDLLDGGFSTLHKHESFPIGSVFFTEDSTNPNTLLGYGTWSLLGTITL